MANPTAALRAPQLAGRFDPLSVDWFLLLVIAGGFLSYLQHTFLGQPLPVEITLRALLVIQIAALLVFGRTRREPLPGLLPLAIALFAVSSVVSLAISMFSGTDPARAGQAFYFMFNVGAFLVALPLIPLRARGGIWLKAFFVLALGFGAVQVLAQDLLIPPTLRFEFGLLFDRFINGNIRAIGFFASAPRFAECVVFVSCYVLHRLLTPKPRTILFWLAAYALCLWLLFNTYSRSGYVLWGAAFLIQIFWAAQAQFRRGSNLPILFLFYSALMLLAVPLAIAVSRSGQGQLYIGDITSLLARMRHWSSLGAGFGESGFLNLLFGSGEAAMFSRFSLDYFVIDNVFLQQVTYAGLFGLLVFVFLFVEVLRVGAAVQKAWPSLNLTPLLAFYAALPFEGLTVDNHNTIFLTQFAILALIGRAGLDAPPATSRPAAGIRGRR